MRARRGRVIPFPRRAGEPEPAPSERRLVEVLRADHAEAVVVRGLLESADIPVVLRSRLAHSVHPFTVGAQGEVVVLVPPATAPHARRLLARVRVGRGPRNGPPNPPTLVAPRRSRVAPR